MKSYRNRIIIWPISHYRKFNRNLSFITIEQAYINSAYYKWEHGDDELEYWNLAEYRDHHIHRSTLRNFIKSQTRFVKLIKYRSQTDSGTIRNSINDQNYVTYRTIKGGF